LDDFSETVRKLSPEHGGIGHNGSPDFVPISEAERSVILEATANTRAAVLSSDYKAANLAWSILSPIIKRIGNAISRHIETLFNKAAIVAGAGIGLISIDYLGYEIGLWDKAEGIRAVLDIAKHLTH
jgi:hypothetical protein